MQDYANWNGRYQETASAQGLGLSFGYQNGNQYENAHNSVHQNGQSPLVATSVEWSPYLRNAQLVGHHRAYSPAAGSPDEINPHRGHHRSGSTIDTLATVALATSPTFAHTSPVEQGPWSRAQTPPKAFDESDYHERPAKRAKSEKLRSPMVGRKDIRPATSHVASYDSMRNDAELLLNFARPAMNNSHWTPYADSKSMTLPMSTFADPERPPHSPLTPPPAPLLPLASPVHSPTIFESGPVPIEFEGQALDDEHAPALEHIDKQSATLAREVQPHPRENKDATRSLKHETIEQQEAGHIERAGQITTSVKPTPVYARSDPGSSQDFPTVTETSSKETRPRKKKATTESICGKCNQTQLIVADVDQGATEEWIECNGCNKWYHYFCVDLKDEREVQSIDKFICSDCEPIHGPTTYVRKSSRARTMIDYAGLNEGVIQTSSETNEHLYSRALREGKMKCMSDNFARIRPELATIENLESWTGGWNRPIVIPAKWNPRSITHAKSLSLIERYDHEHSPSLEAFEQNDPEDDDYMSDREYEEVADVEQDCLDMVIPHGLTVPLVAELIGLDEKVVDVIDVKTQNGENKKWSMRRWAEYYTSQVPNKQIRNVISLEVSKYKLGRLIRRPKVVRDMDILDHVWPPELDSQFPAVQFYCLMSVADCYTDFHVDFGGSSVYYHIVKGKKTFFFIPPEEKNIRQYEDWCNSGQQHANFLGDLCSECRRVDLSEGDTMLIPAGWIHAVWTPEDSLVIGGNFLTRTNYDMQLRIWESEKKCKIDQKFRYPHFQKVMWFAAIKYMADDPVPEPVLQAFQSDSDYMFSRNTPVWQELTTKSAAEPGSSEYNARYYSKKEIGGLVALRDFLRRTTLISAGHLLEGVTVKSREAVKKSMPKGYGDPSQLIRVFAIWCAWKIGNVAAPEWVNQPDQPLQQTVAALIKKKKPEPPRLPPERQSARVQELAQAQAEAEALAQAQAEAEAEAQAEAQAQAEVQAQAQALAQALAQAEAGAETQLITVGLPPVTPGKRSFSEVSIKDEPVAKKPRTTPKSSGLGPKRVACDVCRKRRIRCRHKDEDQMNTDGVNYNSSVEVTPSGYGQLDGVNAEYPQGTISVYGEFAPMTTPVTQGSTTQAAFAAPTTKKAGRTRACDECRKSKRRCVHDENGKIDPIKLQEPSRPRGSGGAKRPRPSDEIPMKKAKRPSNGRDVSPAEAILVGQAQSALAQAGLSHGNGFSDDMIDPALMEMDQSKLMTNNGYYPANGNDVPHAAGDSATNQAIAALALEAQAQTQADISSLLDPQIFGPGDEVSQSMEPTDVNNTQRAVPSHDCSAPFASPPNSLLNEADIRENGNGPDSSSETITNSIEVSHDLLEAKNALNTPQSSSRHSSRQPKAAAPTTNSTTAPVPPTSSRRRESSGSHEGTKSDHTTNSTSTKTTTVTTATTITDVSGHHPSSSHPTSPMSNPRGRSGSANKLGRLSAGEIDADEESKKLIRELQAQDLGLRRRG